MTLSTEQLAARAKGIGGSDVAALLGISKWKTPVQLWAEKRGELPPDEPKNVEAIHFGNVLEDVVADEFTRRTEIRVRRDRKHYQHKDHSFMLGNIDRRVIAHEYRSALECKTGNYFTGKDWGESGSDEVPFWYMAQAAHYMATLELERMYVAVLIGGQDFRWFWIKRDETMIDNLIKREAEFWQRVQDGEPPDPQSDADLAILYPTDNGQAIDASPAMLDALTFIDTTKAKIKRLDSEVKDRTFELKKMIGENAEIVLGENGDKVATWKSHETNRLDAKKLRAEEPEIAKRYTTTSTVRPFRLA